MSEYEEAANRLHHLSFIFAGDVIIAADQGAPYVKTKMFPTTDELRNLRYLIDRLLLVRGDINVITAILVEKGIVTKEDLVKRLTEEYELITKEALEMINAQVARTGYQWELTDVGFRIKKINNNSP